MFAKYFVTCSVAVELKKAGFDEPCLGYHEYYSFEGQQHERLIIGYSNQPTTPEIYNATIQQALAERPGLFKEMRKNSLLPPWHYAAPLYQQAFDWFEAKGLYLHDYISPYKDKRHYGVNIFDNDNNCIWPTGRFFQNYIETKASYLHENKQDAWNQAIIAASQIHNP